MWGGREEQDRNGKRGLVELDYNMTVVAVMRMVVVVMVVVMVVMGSCIQYLPPPSRALVMKW